MKKRILSLLIAFAILLPLCPTGLIQANATDAQTPDVTVSTDGTVSAGEEVDTVETVPEETEEEALLQGIGTPNTAAALYTASGSDENSLFTKLDLSGSGLAEVKAAVQAKDYNAAKTALLNYYKTRFASYETMPFSGTTSRLITHVMKNMVCYQENYVAFQTIQSTQYKWYDIDLGTNVSGQYVLDATVRSNSEIVMTTKERGTDVAPYLTVTMSDGSTRKVTASADAYVQAGSNEKNCYGDRTWMLIQHTVSNDGKTEIQPSAGEGTVPYSSESKRVYLIFNVPSGAKSAVLHVNAYVKGQNGNPSDEAIEIAVFNSFAKNWKEDTLNWWYLRTNEGEAEKTGKSESAKLVGLFGHFCYDGVKGGFDWKNPGGAHQEWINYNTRFYEITTLLQKAAEQPANKVSYLNYAKATLMDFISDTYSSGTDYRSCPAGRDIEAANRAAEFPYIYDMLLTNGLLSAEENYQILCWIYAETEYMYHDRSQQLFQDTSANPTTKSYAATNRGAWHLMGLYSNLKYFSEFADSGNWRTTFDARLAYVLDKLINEDGSYSEMTFAYPVDCLGWFQYLLNLMGSFNEKSGAVDQIRRKMIKLTKYLIDCSYSDGTMPRWGEGGARDVSDAVDLLLKMIPEDSSAEYQNILWFKDHTTGIMPDTASKYGDVSVVTDRTGWTEDATMLFMNAKVGGNHSHRDALALTLFFDGTELLADTGMTSYTAGTKEFTWQRGRSASHNTVEVDGIGQLYSLTQLTNRGKLISYGANDAYTFIRGWTNATQALPIEGTGTAATAKNMEHSRNVTFVKSVGEFLIVSDYVKAFAGSTYNHTYTQNWHTDPGATITANGTTGTATFANGPTLTIVQAADSTKSVGLDVSKDSYDVGSSSPVKFFQYSQKSTGDVSFNTVLYPTAYGENATVTAEALETGASDSNVVSAMKITITKDGSTNTVYYYNSFEAAPVKRTIAAGTARSASSFTTDAATALVAMDESGLVTELSLAGGKTLEIGNIRLTTSAQVTDLTATVKDGVLDIQSSDPGVVSGTTAVYATWTNGTKIQSVTLNGESGVEYSIVGNVAVLNPTNGLLLHFDEISALNTTDDWSIMASNGKVDTQKSEISGTFNGTAYNNATNGLVKSNTKFSYTVQPGDELEIRTKIQNNDLEGNKLWRIVVDYWFSDGTQGRSQLLDTQAPMDTGNGYEVYNFGSLNSYAGKTITTFQIGYYIALKSNSDPADYYKSEDAKVTGAFAIDYIYVGQEKSAPSHDDEYLLFDFTNTQQDKSRYDSDIYGNINYDTLDKQADNKSNEYAWFQWWGIGAGQRDDWFAIDNSKEGTLTVKRSNKDYSLYAQTGWKDSAANGLPLNYSPGKDDFIQIRVRFENCELRPGYAPELKVYYAADSDAKVKEDKWVSMNLDPDHIASGEYMVYTVSVTQAMAAANKITALRVMFDNVDVRDADAKVVIDYIYVGREEHLPHDIMEDVPYLPSNSYDGATVGTDADVIEYPNDGAVRLNKTATAANWNSTGIAQVELDAAGISVPSGLDVMFVLDVSNSMAWSVENGSMSGAGRLPTGNQTTKLYDALSMMDEMSRELLAEGDNTVSLVTFAGYDKENYDTSSQYSSEGFLDSVQTLFTAETNYDLVQKALSLTRVTGYVYTDASDGKQKVDYRISLAKINGTSVTTDTGKNMGGTNYDFAFWQANKTAEAIQKQNETANKTDRKTVVVFLTDGLATVYSDECSYDSLVSYGNSIGHYKPGTKDQPKTEGTTNADWFARLKTIGANKYAETLLANIDRLEVVGFDMTHGLLNGMAATEDNLGAVKNILEGIVTPGESSDKIFNVTDAADAVALDQFQNELVGALKYAATYTKVTDTIGENYDLEMSQGHTIEVRRHTLDDQGERAGDPVVLETVTFNADGTEAYSSKLGMDQNILRIENGVTTISAAFFTFTKAASSNEVFNWRIGRIDGCEYTLVYDVYLTGSMEGTREKGTYPTNERATLEYLDINNMHMSRDYPVPELNWGGAATRAEYYLVNENGEPVNSNGYVIPFANRIIVGYSELIEMNWNTEKAVYGATYVPSGYTLFNPAAYYTVKASSDGSNDTFAIAPEETETTKRVDGGANTAYTQVAFGVMIATNVEVLTSLNPDTVVLDYGKPIDINVTANETDTQYRFTAVGLAAYNQKTDLKIQVGEGKWTSQIIGSSGVFTIENGIVTYTLNKMMSGQDDVFVVVKITSSANAGQFCYAYQRLSVIPATNVLYETDFADGVFTTSGESTGWVNNLGETAGKDGKQDDGTPGGAVDNTADTSLFFGFDNSDVAKERYSGAAYGNTNFDGAAAWFSNKNRVQNFQIANGTLSFSHLGASSSNATKAMYVLTGTSESDLTKLLMRFDASKADYAEIRIKFENFVAVDGKTPLLELRYSTETSASWAVLASETIALDSLSSGQYVTLTLPTKDAFRSELISAIRVQLLNINSISNTDCGKVTIDYIYIGSEEDLPSKQNLYIGFDNTYGDRVRYSGGVYGGVDYDDTASWFVNKTRTSGMTVTDGTMVVTPVSGDTRSQYFQTGGGESADQESTYKLNFDADKTMYAQIRLKLEGFSTTSTPTVSIHAFKEFENGIKLTQIASGNVNAEALDGREYVTFTAKVQNAVTIKSLRVQLGNVTAGNNAKITVDYIYIGSEAGLPMEQVYGYDSSYTDDVKYSNGSALYAEGQGRTKTTVDFDFTGTGFDIISATGKEQGSIRVTVTRKSTGEVVRTVSVVNKSDTELDLYQIPVASVENLGYDTYHVQIGVNTGYSNANYPALYRGNQFVLDAVRIYDSLPAENSETAYDAYATDNELHPWVAEIRDDLLGKGTESGWEDGIGFTSGFGFVDYFNGRTEGDELEQDKLVLNDYLAIGPKNEVYLSKGQAVTFKVTTDAIPTGMDIGAKSADGREVIMNATIAASKDATLSNTVTKNIATSTALFYDLFTGTGASNAIGTIFAPSGSSYTAYVTVANTGEGILSLTDVKLTYGVEEQDMVQTAAFSVDADTMVYATRVMTALFAVEDTPVVKDGIVSENGSLYYYVDGTLQYNAGLVKLGGSYYYVRSNGKLATGNYWVTNTNGLMAEGFYIFGADGKMVVSENIHNGIVSENGGLYYYVNGNIQYNAGLVELNGSYYYVRSNGQCATGKYWVTNTNGLMAEGFYTFGTDGKMAISESIKNGIVSENGGLYYYVNGNLQYNAGLVELDGSYYYVRSNGQCATGNYWVTNTNGLMAEGFYTFGTDGKMVISESIKNGIVSENGGLYYYVNGSVQYNAGLVELNGSYYYVRSNGQCATGGYWVTNTNGLMAEGLYTFGADGKMIVQ